MGRPKPTTGPGGGTRPPKKGDNDRKVPKK